MPKRVFITAAEVSGVAALLIERNPALTPADIRRILMRTAKDFFTPLAVGAPTPPREIPARPSRAIHFFDLIQDVDIAPSDRHSVYVRRPMHGLSSGC